MKEKEERYEEREGGIEDPKKDKAKGREVERRTTNECRNQFLQTQSTFVRTIS